MEKIKLFSIRFAVAGVIVGSFAMANIQEKKEEKTDLLLLGLKLPKTEITLDLREGKPIAPVPRGGCGEARSDAGDGSTDPPAQQLLARNSACPAES